MALPRRKGLRPITVGGQRFRWRFDGIVLILPDGTTGRRPLHLDFGWTDPYLVSWQSLPENEPQTVTPAFVAAAIEYALTHGWDTAAHGGRFLLRYNKEVGFHAPRNQSSG